MATCLKCEKEYIPKRRGGKFCSTNCRVSHHERGRKLQDLTGEYIPEELRLERLLKDVVQLADLLKGPLSMDHNVRGYRMNEDIQEFVAYCSSLQGGGRDRDEKLREGIIKRMEERGRNAGLPFE